MCKNSLDKLANLVCCPHCFDDLIFIKTEDEFTKKTDDLYCVNCNIRYPIFGDIPFFIDINKSGWVSLSLAKKLWENTDKIMKFSEFMFLLEEISSPTITYEDMGRKFIAYSSSEVCNYHKKLLNDYSKWNNSTKPLYDFVIKKTAELSKSNSIILDIGIGAGELEQDLASILKSKIIGIDKEPAFTAAQIWKEELSGNIPYAMCGDIRKSPFNDKSIDIIISTGGLISVYKVEKALVEIQRIIKDEGYFIFSDFNNTNKSSLLHQEEVEGSLGFEWCLEKLQNLGFIVEEIKENVCDGFSIAVMSLKNKH